MQAKVAISRYQLDKKIPPNDPFWPKFNAGFENREIDAEHLMQSVYDGYSLTTWHKDHWRVTANYICGQHLGLDFDQGDKTSTLAYLLSDSFIRKYAAFMYTTISHTEETPKARVIFLLDSPIMQAKNYTLAASALLWLFGTADRACRDSVRFFYGSKGCQFEYLDNILPLEVVKRLIGQYQETGLSEHKRASRPDYHAPTSQKEVADALAMIDPWRIDYDEWLQILMAIHAEFGEGGFDLAEHWAQGKDGEIERKWKSFSADGNATGAVTIATVFGIAKNFGWKKERGLAV